MTKVKGSHNAMKSGMLAAEAAFEAMNSSQDQSSTGNTPCVIVHVSMLCVSLCMYSIKSDHTRWSVYSELVGPPGRYVHGVV